MNWDGIMYSHIYEYVIRHFLFMLIIINVNIIVYGQLEETSPDVNEPQENESKGISDILNELIEMDLDELSQQLIVVTSVSKTEESQFEAASAISVITQEEIRRSAATEVPDLFRLIPGMQVAKIDANTWAISSRGFNNEFSNKLLVLIDGRTVYNTLFGGVFWRSHDLIIEDIERIEIIRGPGTTLWGGNAVNGVINIITKNAKDTHGGLVTTTIGTENQGIGVRYGNKAIDNNLHYRVWAKGEDFDGNKNSLDMNTPDDWSIHRAGFRIDWDITEQDLLTFIGNYHDSEVDQLSELVTLTPPYSQTMKLNEDHFGADFLIRWEKSISDLEDLTLQLYFDRLDVDTIFSEYGINTVDIDFQHRFELFTNNELIWGLKYRLLSDDFSNQQGLIYSPSSRDIHYLSGFFQDKYKFWDDKLELTLGTKIEHNDYTGFEVQPSARIAWKPNPRFTTWSSITRSVRIPDRTFNDVTFPLNVIPQIPGDTSGLPGQLVFFGNDDVNAESAITTEIGQRIQVTNDFSFDVSAFYSDYDELISAQDGLPFPDFGSNRIVIPLLAVNNAEAETYGFEVEANYQMLEWWNLSAGYSYLDIAFHFDSNASQFAPDERNTENLNPQNQFFVQSYMNLPWNLELDTFVSFVDGLPGTNVEDYVKLDARLGWHPTDNFDISIGARNLLDDKHNEFIDQFFTVATEVERSFFAQLTWRF